MSEESCPEKDRGKTCEICGAPDFPCLTNNLVKALDTSLIVLEDEQMGEFEKRIDDLEDIDDRGGGFYIMSSDVRKMIDEAKKEFPIPYAVLRFKVARDLGLGNVNTFALKEWYEKWLVDE